MSRALRIGVDVRSFEVESTLRRGIGRYASNLLRAMVRRSPEHEYVLLGNRPPWEVSHLKTLLQGDRCRYATYHPSYHENLDVLLLTDPLPLLEDRELLRYAACGLPCATIVYDLIPLAFEREYLAGRPRLQQQYHEHLSALRGIVSRYLTISEFVAEDLIERTHVNRAHVVPILGGLDDAFAAPPGADEVKRSVQRLGITGSYFFYTGGVDFRKNLPVVEEAFALLSRRSSRPAALVLAGETDARWLETRSRDDGSRDAAGSTVALGYVSDDDLRCLYAGAVAFVFPSLYEGFGLPALEAMACGCPVIVSDGSSLREVVGDSGLLINPRAPDEVARAMHRVMDDAALADDLRRRGFARCRRFTWDRVAEAALPAIAAIARAPRRAVAPVRRLKVLIQNRADAFSAPGGDTAVMEGLHRSLSARDVDVDAGVGSPALTNVDIVHLVNLTVPDVAIQTARNALSQHVPYVVTTLFEDWPRYMEKSFAAMELFRLYLERNRDEALFRRGLEKLRGIEGGVHAGSGEVIEHAAMLLTCGESESANLSKAFPGCSERMRIAKFGIASSAPMPDAARRLVRERLGFEKYVVCCGRLETRKNQLMLLKALEDSEIPVVLASGGFSRQAPYVDLVARFTRRGPVHIPGRLDATLLRWLLGAATVHVLPSWFELPGLVTLEAAAAGTAVVASDWGAIQDYLPDGLIHTCQPDDPESIRRAVESAIRQGPNPEAQALAQRFTWDAFGAAVHAAYEEVLTRRHVRPATPHHTPSSKMTEEYQPVEVNVDSVSQPTYRFDVSIVIPVFNRSQLTQECLEALCASGDRASYEVIVVDNHSTDDTSRILDAVEGDMMVLRLPANRGFAAACNLGARMASGRYLVFLNNDTRVQSGWLDALVEGAEGGNAGAVGARLLYPDGDVQHAGVAVSARKIPYHVFQHFPANDPAVMEPRDMQAVTAACMLTPKAIFEGLGGFDEGYRNGFEDVDYCLRLREAGRRVVYCPQSVVVHHEEASEGRKDHDRENLERFLQAWGSRLRPDEEELLARHGYTISWDGGRGEYRRREEVREKVDAAQVARDSLHVSLEAARSLYTAGRLDEAAAALQDMVEGSMTLAGEDSFEAWQTLGNCLTRLNRFDEAEKAYHRAMRFDDKSERPYLGLGTVAMMQENWQAAMYGFMTALAKNPEAMKGEFGVGVSMAARNMHNLAIERFRRVLAQEPENAEALFYLYRSAMESGQPQLAVEPLRAYVERRPKDTPFLFNLCGAYWKSGDLPRAMDVCRRVLELDPQHAAAKEVLQHLKSPIPAHA